LPHPENTTASKRQQGAAVFFLKVVCSVMGTKDCWKDNGPHLHGESIKLATKEKWRAEPTSAGAPTELKIESCSGFQADYLV
jgi:hypothetical protein